MICNNKKLMNNLLVIKYNTNKTVITKYNKMISNIVKCDKYIPIKRIQHTK